MTITLLIVSIILILFWGIIDRRSLKKLSGIIRFGIFTYLLALLAFVPLSYTSKNIEINAICSILGAAFTAITILTIVFWVSTIVGAFNLSRSLKVFLNSAISIIMFLGAGSLLMQLLILQPIRNYIFMGLGGVIIVLGVVAILSIFITVIKLLFGAGKADVLDDVQSDQNTSDK